MKPFPRTLLRSLVPLMLAAAAPLASAHCDTLDGPVVVDARAALAKGDIAPVLKWIRAQDEPEIRAAFARTLAVRGKGDDARQLADTWFFETLVRVHRAGEGAPYTGLKPGGEVEPGIAAADAAIASGSADALVEATTAETVRALRRRFDTVKARREHASHKVEAGRAYVAAYVEFVHFVERLHGVVTATGPAAHEHAH